MVVSLAAAGRDGSTPASVNAAVPCRTRRRERASNVMVVLSRMWRDGGSLWAADHRTARRADRLSIGATIASPVPTLTNCVSVGKHLRWLDFICHARALAQ